MKIDHGKELWQVKEKRDKEVILVSCQPCRREEIRFKIYGIHGQRAHSHILEELYTGLDESSVRVRVRGENSSEGEMEWFQNGCGHKVYFSMIPGPWVTSQLCWRTAMVIDNDYQYSRTVHSPIYYSPVPLLVNEIQNSVAHVLLDHIKDEIFEMFNLKVCKPLPESS